MSHLGSLPIISLDWGQMALIYIQYVKGLGASGPQNSLLEIHRSLQPQGVEAGPHLYLCRSHRFSRHW